MDFLVKLPGNRSVIVEAKHRKYAALSMSDVESAVSQVKTVAGEQRPLVVVTNAPLSPRVLEYNGQTFDDRPPVEVLTWNGDEDSPLLQRAIARTAR